MVEVNWNTLFLEAATFGNKENLQKISQFNSSK